MSIIFSSDTIIHIYGRMKYIGSSLFSFMTSWREGTVEMEMRAVCEYD
jgi:hypothetical protein